MILAVDVDHVGTQATAAGVGFGTVQVGCAETEATTPVEGVGEYRSGLFFTLYSLS